MTITHTLRHRGRDLQVQTWVDREEPKLKNRARLLLDGAEVDAGGAEEIGSAQLATDTDHAVTVRWWWTGRLAGVDLIEEGLGEERTRRLPFAPPPGTRAARRHAWGEAHPALWASRHVLINVAGTLAAILGVSALVSALVNWLLPAINLPNLPSISWPEWVNYLDPGRYLAPLLGWIPDLVQRLFGWLPDGPWPKYVIGFLVAVTIAKREYDRRKRATEEPDDPAEENSAR